jgi:hypothetical protein
VAETSKAPHGDGREEQPQAQSGDDPRPFDSPAVRTHERIIRSEDRVRATVAIATVALLALALAGLYGLILLNREPQQITEWMAGVGLIGSIAGTATGYYFGGRHR